MIISGLAKWLTSWGLRSFPRGVPIPATCKAVKDLSGKPIAEPAAQRLRWQEHFSDLLNHSPSDELDLTDLDSFEKEPSFEYLSEEDGPPNMFEIEYALKRLKNNKSPGVDNISNEQLKYGIEGLKHQLCVIFGKVWEEEAIPADWSKGIIVVILQCVRTTEELLLGLQLLNCFR